MFLRYPTVLVAIAITLTASTIPANPGNGNGFGRVEMFGKNKPFTLYDLPPGRTLDRLESLPEPARRQAMEWLHRFDFPENDLDAMVIDDEGAVLYADPAPTDLPVDQAPAAEGALPEASASAADDAFWLHSRPGAPNVVYLDFDGHTFSGTAWSSGTIQARPFNLDGSPSTFSDAERNAIAEIWHRVAEDFAAFDIDVTTEEPQSFGPQTGRVLITSKTDANGGTMPYGSAGGVAYVNVWGRGDYASKYSPALVYYDNLAKATTYIAEACAHEFGHNLGLSHDGTSSVTYYAGHGSGATSWAPIMGNSYYNNVTQWSIGEYAGANNTQDDLAIIDAKLYLIDDDHGDTLGSASPLAVDGSGQVLVSNPEMDPHNIYPENKGVIEVSGDQDLFYFSTGAGQVDITLTPAWDAFYRSSKRGANLDIQASLLNAGGATLATSDPASETDASLSISVPAGTYYLAVTGVGNGNYSDYASAGQYFIAGSVVPEGSLQFPPTADYDFSCTGMSCSFSDNSSDSDGSITDLSWDFGDGAVSTANNPSHTYAIAGTYVVDLTVTDNDGLTSSMSKSVAVTQPTPVFSINGTITLEGNPLSGIGIAGADCLDSDANGDYSCNVPQGWSGALVPGTAGYTFSPPSRSYTNVTADLTAQDFTATANNDLVWVDDVVPVDSALSIIGSWGWDSSNPAPFSGSLAVQSGVASGLHKYVFYNTDQTLDIEAGDNLFAYVYLDPDNPPQELMLVWQGTGSDRWEHRAYWGENILPYGTEGTAGRRYMGPLPPAGQWVRLEVSSAEMALQGDTVQGLGLLLYGGRASFDLFGKSTLPATSTSLQFSAASYTVAESGLQANLTVTRSGDNSGAVSVDYTSSDSTATAGEDYVAVNDTLYFADGDSTPKQISVDILDDSLYEGDESLTLNLLNPVGAELASPASATLHIADTETAPVFSISGTITHAGTPLSGIGIAGADCLDSDANGDYSCNVPQGWSGALVPGTAGYTFTPPSRSYTNVTADLTAQDFTATANNDLVWVDDVVPVDSALSIIGSWGWNSSNPAPFSGSLAVQSGVASGLHKYVFYNTDQTLDIEAGDNLFAYVYLDPDNPPQELMLVWQGTGSDRWEHRAYWGENILPYGTEGTAGRRYMGPLPPAGQWVRLEVSSAEMALQGDTVQGLGLLLYGGRASFDLFGKSTLPATSTSLQFSAASYTVAESGLQANLTVTRSGDNSGAVSVDYTSSDSTATAGEDYVAVNDTLYFADGDSTPKQISVDILDDSLYEGDESLTLNLLNPVGAELASPASATLHIADTETAPVFSISGTITHAGTPLSGIGIAGADCLDSDANGDYSCNVPQGWSGALVPGTAGYTFTPPSRSYTNVTADLTAQDFTATANNDLVWVDDVVPVDSALSIIGSWGWNSSNPAPFSGSLAVQSGVASGLHKYVFYNTDQTLDIEAGDNLFAYVYLDPDNPPQELMLVWQGTGSDRWEHRAYWGENILPYGTEGTAGRRYMGPLPPAGQWVRLEVSSAEMALQGDTVQGLGLLLYGGRASFDLFGKN